MWLACKINSMHLVYGIVLLGGLSFGHIYATNLSDKLW